MAKGNIISSLKTEESSGVVPDLQDRLANEGKLVDIPETGPKLTIGAPTADPAVTTEEGFTMAPEATPEEAGSLEQRQMDLEEAQSLSDLTNSRPVYMGPDDIVKIWGPDQAGRVIDGYKNLTGTDSLNLPRNQADRTDTLKSMMGSTRTPEALEEMGNINFVDAKKTKPLNNAELFGHLDAFETDTASPNGFKVLPGIQILALGVVEQKLIESLAAAELVPQAMRDNFSGDEIQDLTGLSPQELEAMESEGQLGRVLAEEWTKNLQRETEGPDARLEWHMDPDRELTKEGYEHLGLWAKQTYQLAHPDILTRVDAKTKSGKVRKDYALTHNGTEILKASKAKLLPPGVKARVQLTATPESTTQYSKTNTAVGKTYKEPSSSGKQPKEEEARTNLAEVRHLVTSVRLKMGMFLSLLGIGSASQVTYNKETNKIVVPDNSGAILGVGQDVVDQINSKSAMSLLKRDSLGMQLSNMQMTDPRREGIADKMKALQDFSILAATGEWKMRTYQLRATKALEMLQDVAEFKDDHVSFTNYLQRGTSRISYSSQKMNIQTHHLARQLFGSSTKYVVSPGSNSAAEWAMLVTMGSHLFGDGNSAPDQVYKNMRQRVSEGDPKLLAIASVGRKLKGILQGFDADPTAAAVLAMDTNEKGNIVGVNDVLSTRTPFDADPEVAKYIEEALNHPNETIHIIEEAIELGNYMDSIKSGKPFDSTMRPLEVDGISNGLASLGMQLGLQHIMHRVGVLSADPTKILANFDGVEGNLRVVLAENMRDLLSDIVKNKNFIKEFKLKGDFSEYDDIKAILDLAIQNPSSFLKPPLMTFAYGQAISSMGGLMLDTVTGSPELSKAADMSPWKKAGVANMLHRILGEALTDTLGKQVVDFTEAIKDVTELAAIADEPLIITLPTGTKSSINVSSFQTDPDAKPIDVRILDANDKEASRAAYLPTTSKIGGIDETNPASSMATKILAQAIISFDGATIVNTLSGAPYRYLQKSTSQKTPYVATIYDAVIGDLGSFRPLMETVNSVWKDTTLNFNLIQEIADGSKAAYAAGKKKLEAVADEDPKGIPQNQQQVRKVLDVVYNMIRVNPVTTQGASQMYGDILTKAAESKLAYLSDPKVSRYDKNRVGSDSSFITNAELLSLYKAAGPLMRGKLAKVQKISDDAVVDRRVLRNKIGNKHVYQYAPDALKDGGIKYP